MRPWHWAIWARTGTLPARVRVVGTYVKARVGEGFPFELISGNHESLDVNDGDINDFSACLPNQIPGIVGTYGARVLHGPATGQSVGSGDQRLPDSDLRGWKVGVCHRRRALQLGLGGDRQRTREGRPMDCRGLARALPVGGYLPLPGQQGLLQPAAGKEGRPRPSRARTRIHAYSSVAHRRHRLWDSRRWHVGSQLRGGFGWCLHARSRNRLRHCRHRRYSAA